MMIKITRTKLLITPMGPLIKITQIRTHGAIGCYTFSCDFEMMQMEGNILKRAIATFYNKSHTGLSKQCYYIMNFFNAILMSKI